MLGLLSDSLWKNFGSVSKILYTSLLTKLKEKNKLLVDEILITLEKFTEWL